MEKTMCLDNYPNAKYGPWAKFKRCKYCHSPNIIHGVCQDCVSDEIEPKIGRYVAVPDNKTFWAKILGFEDDYIEWADNPDMAHIWNYRPIRGI